MKPYLYALLFFLSFKAHSIDIYCNGAPSTIHSNGGGRIALTVLIDANSYVGPGAVVCEYATITGYAQIRDSAKVFGTARIGDGSIVSGNAEVFDNASLISNPPLEIVKVSGFSKVYGNARILDGATIANNSKVFENARVSSTALIDDNSQIYGNATITGKASIKGNSKIYGRSTIGGSISSLGTTEVCDGRYFEGTSILNNVIFCNSSGTADLSLGQSSTCSLNNNGFVRCWGTYGVLGSSGNVHIGDDELPSSVSFLNLGGAAYQIYSGRLHSCAITSQGVKCWGYNNSGQIGNGTGQSLLPALINIGNEKLLKMFLSEQSTCSLHEGNRLKCWGSAGVNASTVANSSSSTIPSSYFDLGGAVLEASVGAGHACALLSSGSVRCWGYNAQGQVGKGALTGTSINYPPTTDVAIGGVVTQIVSGSNHSCALLNTGSVRCWGYGNDGQLGYGSTASIGDNELPSSAGDVPVGGIVTQLSAGGEVTCALLNTGTARCWGKNDFGQLGYGHTNNVGDNEFPSSMGDIDVGGAIKKIITKGSHTCASLVSGKVKCWGYNNNGQLGYGNTDIIGDNEFPSSVGTVMNLVKSKSHEYEEGEQNEI